MDTGTGDSFLSRELKPEALEAAAAKAGFPFTSRMQVRSGGRHAVHTPAVRTPAVHTPAVHTPAVHAFSSPAPFAGAPALLPVRVSRGFNHTYLPDTHNTDTQHTQEGYDHSYFFISTFMEEHVDFHADALLGKQ